jgi:hypothetical protein
VSPYTRVRVRVSVRVSVMVKLRVGVRGLESGLGLAGSRVPMSWDVSHITIY